MSNGTHRASPSSAPPPLVSIGFPVYNRAALLVPALESLLGQTYQRLEIIVCDNASTDGTGEKCREYARRDPRVKYFRNDTNIGPRGSSGNFGRVLSLASGKYFMWCASDDRRPPTVIAEAVAALERNPAAVMAHGAVRLHLESEDRYLEVANAMDLSDARPDHRIATFTRRLQHNAILYGLYRRDAIVDAILPKHYADDYLFCLQACLLGPFEYVRGPLLTYRQRYTRISPMYPRDVTSPTVLLLYRGVRRSKCWTALVMGVYYLMRLRSVPFGARVSGSVAHLSSFTRRYRRELATELLFLACTPLHRLLRPLAPAGVRLRAALRGAPISQS